MLTAYVPQGILQLHFQFKKVCAPVSLWRRTETDRWRADILQEIMGQRPRRRYCRRRRDHWSSCLFSPSPCVFSAPSPWQTHASSAENWRKKALVQDQRDRCCWPVLQAQATTNAWLRPRNRGQACMLLHHPKAGREKEERKKKAKWKPLPKERMSPLPRPPKDDCCSICGCKQASLLSSIVYSVPAVQHDYWIPLVWASHKDVSFLPAMFVLHSWPA